MLQCKGVLVSAATSTCRTLMTEALLRHMTADRLAVVSGGLDFNLPISRHVGFVLGEVGVVDEYTAQSKGISRLMREQGKTFDVMVSFGDAEIEEEHSKIPSHWTVAADSGNASRKWTVWSPRNPSIEHENSVRKFQDHLYRGEALFSTRNSLRFRQRMKINKRWDIERIEPIPMERPHELIERHRHVRNLLIVNCTELLGEMEALFEEKLLFKPLTGFGASAAGACAIRQ